MLSKNAAKLLAALLLLTTLPAPAQPGIFAERLRQRQSEETLQLAGLNVAVWRPTSREKSPLVIFSHGFGGSATQSRFLMQALARDGYLVIAPNHKDARGSGGPAAQPQSSFRKAEDWSDTTHEDRREDIINLLQALHRDPAWDRRIDWSKLALCGHSLGGYTVLGLGGAWPSWKIDGVKAIVALSPYCAPYALKGALGSLNVPVMYQGGTRDWGITPGIKGPQGAFAKTSSPAYFVEFDQAGHFAWTNFNRNTDQEELINRYTLAFLDKYIRGAKSESLSEKETGVKDLQIK
ncbi:MAG: alpha/beta fold hydrolase [Cyanobacteria bacterium SZAS TMP-1]|nr:alpha/beta fold hydrolase [Cyanobacteria bacterium SZAS TMP-1]